MDCQSWNKPKQLGLSWYGVHIMFYLAGMPERVARSELPTIQAKVAKLQLPIRNLPNSSPSY